MTCSVYTADDRGLFSFAGAHLDTLIYRARGCFVEHLPVEGMWLGVGPDIDPETTVRSFRLDPGDALVLYTDGVTEARSAAHEQYGVKRFAAQIIAYGTSSPTSCGCICSRMCIASWRGRGTTSRSISSSPASKSEADMKLSLEDRLFAIIRNLREYSNYKNSDENAAKILLQYHPDAGLLLCRELVRHFGAMYERLAAIIDGHRQEALVLYGENRLGELVLSNLEPAVVSVSRSGWTHGGCSSTWPIISLTGGWSLTATSSLAFAECGVYLLYSDSTMPLGGFS
jgi:hypothetical protein